LTNFFLQKLIFFLLFWSWNVQNSRLTKNLKLTTTIPNPSTPCIQFYHRKKRTIWKYFPNVFHQISEFNPLRLFGKKLFYGIMSSILTKWKSFGK
jgi:hypothetical protein